MNAVAHAPIDMDLANKALNRTKIALMVRPESAFFTTLCFSLTHSWDDSIPTACCDGLEISYNPRFWLAQDADEQLFLMLHETLHAAYLHMDRLMDFDPRKWNRAADYVINAQLIEAGFKMPKGGLYDPQYAGLSTEEVYKLLPDDPNAPCDMDLRAPSVPSKELKDQMDEILVRAAIAVQMAGQDPGTIPGQLRRYIEELTHPKIPWHRLLSRFFSRMIKAERSFRKPNRRYFPEHILPTAWSPGMGWMACFIDASCSVTDERFARCGGELYPVLRNLRPQRLTLGQFDTRITGLDELRSEADLKRVQFTGKGGTRIQPVMEWAAKNKPAVLVIFSDGEFRECNIKPACPVIWLIYENPKFTARYGKVIHID